MDNISMTWTVIQFIDDGSVEAVPSSWIQGDICHWPSYSQPKLVSAIRKCETLNTCWPTHKIKQFRNSTFDDYMKARNKAKIAEETSDLNTTADENDDNTKRKRIPKILSSDESSEYSEEQLLGPPPRLTKLKQKCDLLKDKRSMPEHNSLSLSLPALNTESSNNETQCNNCKDKDKDIKTLIQQNHVLRGLMTDILAEIKDIKTRLDKNSGIQQTSSSTLRQNSLFKAAGINFPINSDNEFELFENYLNSEQEFESAADELSRLGGSTVYDLVRRSLSSILDNEQTLKYSWLGRKGKRPFNQCQIAKVLIESVRRAGLGKCAKETEVAIQTWIRRASDRRSLIRKKL